MEGISVIIPVFNKIEVTEKCIDFIKEKNKNSFFEIVVVDNGSADGTREKLSSRGDISYIRNEQNLGISKACNIGASIARYETLCFMHNDVFVYEQEWGTKISDFLAKKKGSGITGLYGAKTIRRDGSFRGKTIVHSKKDSPLMRKPFEKVAVVDGMLMSMKKTVFQKIGGFNESFMVHYYDKDISMRALNNGFVNYVINVPFEHICATTRNQIEKEDEIRDISKKKFIEIWSDYLPVDVSTWRDKIGYLFK